MFGKRASKVLFASGAALIRRKSDDAIIKSKAIKKSVFISQSTDVFTNLALEEWFFKNMDFTHHHVMMLWRNDPCVVIGKHQNPWLETDVAELNKQGVKIARRNTGGGSVYNDLGNLNITFFTSNQDYNKGNNLEIISRALYREWGLNTNINQNDIFVRNDFKVSETAAKLTSTNSYQHCGLLVDVNKAALGNALLQRDLGIETNAPKSARSPILNLKDENHHIHISKVMSSVGWEFLRTDANELIDHGLQHASKQNGFKYINPSEGWYPQLTSIRNQLASWDWVYGKSPNFTSNLAFPISDTKLQLSVKVEKGKVDDVVLQVPSALRIGFTGDAHLYNAIPFKGFNFSEGVLEQLKKVLPDVNEHKQVAVQSVN